MRTHILWTWAIIAAIAVASGCQPAAEEPGKGKTEPAETPAAGAAKGVAWAVAQAPADACLLVAVRNMGEVEASLKALIGETDAPIELVKELEGALPAGAFDGTGPVVLIVPSGLEKTAPVSLLVVKDAAKLVGETADGIMTVKYTHDMPKAMPPGHPAAMEKTLYVHLMDGWAAVSDNLAAIKAVAGAKSRFAPADADLEALKTRSVWLHLNPPALQVMASKSLEDLKQHMSGPDAPPMPPTVMPMANYGIDLLKQVGAAGLTADIKPTGITVEAIMKPTDASPMAGVMGAFRTIKTYGGGLPASDDLFLAAWGRMDWPKAIGSVKQLVRPLMDIFLADADEKTRAQADKLLAMYDEWGPIMGDQVAMALMPAPDGQGMYRLVETFEIKDADKYRELIKKYMVEMQDAMQAIMANVGMMGAPGAPQIKMAMEFKEAAETIEGLPVDLMTFKVQVQAPEGAPPEAAAQMKAMMDAMYGPDGMVFRMALVDGRGVAAMGDAAFMAQAIKAARGQAPTLDAQPRIKAAVAAMPEGTSMAAIVSLGGYARMSFNMVDRMMRMQMPPEILEEAKKAAPADLPALPAVAADTPPMTISCRMAGGAAHVTVSAPKADIDAAVSQFKTGAKRMQWFMGKMQEMQQKQMQQMPALPGAAPAAPPEAPKAAPATPEPAAQK